MKDDLTTSDEWVRERAEFIMRGVGLSPSRDLDQAITTALQEAIERGEKQAEDLARLKSLANPNDPSFHEGRQSILARLENPDEALLLSFVEKLEAEYPDAFIQGRPERLSMDGKFDMHWLCRALADHLASK